MKVTIRDPKTQRCFKPVHEVSDQEPSLVVSTEKVVLGPFERKLVSAPVISQQPNEYRFRNVMIHPSGVYNRCFFVSEDTLTTVGDEGMVFLAVRNRTSYEKVVIYSKTVLDKAEPTTFEFRPIAVEQTGEASALFIERNNNMNAFDLSESSSEFSSFAQNFLPSIEMSEAELSENEKRERTDPVAQANSGPRPFLCPVFLAGRSER